MVRFYLFDGKAALGPYDAEELLKLPGFGAESIVCPVGAEKVDDWRPAISYDLLKTQLFKPLPLPSLATPPQFGEPCARCAHRNPRGSVYCNRCAAPLSGAPPASFTALPPAPAPAPAPTVQVPPAVAAMPRLPPPSAPPEPESAPLVFTPAPAPPPTPWKTYAASAAAVLTTFLIFFIWLKPKKKPAPPTDAPALVMAAPKAEAVPAARREAAARPPARPKPSTALPKPLPTVLPDPVHRRRRRRSAPPPEPPSAPPPEALPEPLPEQPEAAPNKPAAEEKKLNELLESSIPKKAPQKVKPEDPSSGPTIFEKPKPAAPKLPEGLVLPGIPQRLEPRPQPSAVDHEKLALDGAREQFDFCHQLIRQQAYGDVFDTCLCRGARKAAPYKGDKEVYVTVSRQTAAAAALEGKENSSLEIASAKLTDPSTAQITARWKGGKKNKGKETTETWQLEEGLWCLQP